MLSETVLLPALSLHSQWAYAAVQVSYPTVHRGRRGFDSRTIYSSYGELIMKGLQAWEMGFRGRYLAQVNLLL